MRAADLGSSVEIGGWSNCVCALRDSNPNLLGLKVSPSNLLTPRAPPHSQSHANMRYVQAVRTYVRLAGPPNAAPKPLLPNRTVAPIGIRGLRPVEIRDCRHHGNVEFGHYAARRWAVPLDVQTLPSRSGHAAAPEGQAHPGRGGGGCCAVCGYDRTVVNLHFHHVDPSTKSVRRERWRRASPSTTFRSEAAKCVLVCANCHGEIEAGLIPSPPPQARWGEEWTPVEPAPTVEPEVIPDQAQLPLTDSD